MCVVQAVMWARILLASPKPDEQFFTIATSVTRALSLHALVGTAQPDAVTTILAELGMDTTTLVAALLHDTVEDPPYPRADIRVAVGEDVGRAVGGGPKPDTIKDGATPAAGTARQCRRQLGRRLTRWPGGHRPPGPVEGPGPSRRSPRAAVATRAHRRGLRAFVLRRRLPS